jgi:hypothetical protein
VTLLGDCGKSQQGDREGDRGGSCLHFSHAGIVHPRGQGIADSGAGWWGSKSNRGSSSRLRGLRMTTGFRGMRYFRQHV